MNEFCPYCKKETFKKLDAETGEVVCTECGAVCGDSLESSVAGPVFHEASLGSVIPKSKSAMATKLKRIDKYTIPYEEKRADDIEFLFREYQRILETCPKCKFNTDKKIDANNLSLCIHCGSVCLDLPISYGMFLESFKIIEKIPLQSRSLQDLTVLSILYACIIHQIPITGGEIVTRLCKEFSDIERNARRIKRSVLQLALSTKYNMQFAQKDLEVYAYEFFPKIQLREEVRKNTLFIISSLKERNAYSGRNPLNLVVGIIYLLGGGTARDLAKTASINVNTVTENCKFLLKQPEFKNYQRCWPWRIQI